MKDYFFALLILVLVTSCLDTSLDATHLSSDSQDFYLEPGSSFDGLTLDAYRVVGITPDDSGWDVVVEYSGGCETHDFYVIWSGTWAESFPDRTNVRLGHVGNGDLCEALVRDTLRLDFDRLFLGTYPQETGGIISLENVSNGRQIEVHPGLAAMDQGRYCSINTGLFSTPCGNGIWSNKWLKVQDSVAFHDLVWIKPVINDPSVSLATPEEGNYKVGVTLIFGYESVEVSCQALPDDAVTVHAAINCITPN